VYGQKRQLSKPSVTSCDRKRKPC